LGRPDVVALMVRAANAGVGTAVPAIATIDLPLERRGRTVGAVAGFAGAAARKGPGTAPPTLAAHSALEPGTAALDNALRAPRAEALPGTDGVSGGDEFAIVLPDTIGEGAMALDDRFQIALTVSVGVATLPGVSISADGRSTAPTARCTTSRIGARMAFMWLDSRPTALSRSVR